MISDLLMNPTLNNPVRSASSRTAVLEEAERIDIAYVGYGLLIVTACCGGCPSFFSRRLQPLAPSPPASRPQDIDLELMMAPPLTAGHLLGTDFMGRDMLSRLIVGIQAYFLPDCSRSSSHSSSARVLGVLAGYRGGKWDTASPISPISSIPSRGSCDPARYRCVQGRTSTTSCSSWHHERACGRIAHQGKVLFLKQKNFIEADIALAFLREPSS